MNQITVMAKSTISKNSCFKVPIKKDEVLKWPAMKDSRGNFDYYYCFLIHDVILNNVIQFLNMHVHFSPGYTLSV